MNRRQMIKEVLDHAKVGDPYITANRAYLRAQLRHWWDGLTANAH